MTLLYDRADEIRTPTQYGQLYEVIVSEKRASTVVKLRQQKCSHAQFSVHKEQMEISLGYLIPNGHVQQNTPAVSIEK